MSVQFSWDVGFKKSKTRLLFENLKFLPEIWIVLDSKLLKNVWILNFFPISRVFFPIFRCYSKSNHSAIRQFENRTSPIFRSPLSFYWISPEIFYQNFFREIFCRFSICRFTTTFDTFPTSTLRRQTNKIWKSPKNLSSKLNFDLGNYFKAKDSLCAWLK